MNWVDYLVIPVAKIVIFAVGVLAAVPVLVLAERKLLGWAQNRPGPNRVGPWGTLQTLADGIKLFFKEDIVPAQVDRWLYHAAPILCLVPALAAVAVIPFAPDWHLAAGSVSLFGWKIAWAERTIRLGIADLNIGLLFYFALASLAVYGVVLSGWSSNNKYSFLGGLRSSAQMISYELPLGLSVAGAFLLAGSFRLDGPQSILAEQSGGIWEWLIWRQPAAFVLFLCSGFAETNRLPFDLPEGESELTGGYHTEFSSMRFAMFYMSEYVNIVVVSAFAAVLFLGGYHGPVPTALTGFPAVVAGLFWFSAKIAGLFFLFVLTRATLPRLRYDQLMHFGWKVLLPLGLANVAGTGLIVAAIPDSRAAQGIALFLFGAAALVVVERALTRLRRRVLYGAS